MVSVAKEKPAAKEKGAMVAAGGRGGIGNIVHKDQVAPPPAPMEPSLEVETARDRLTTHGRGGKGNQFWHVLAEGVFPSVILYEQRVVLLKRARHDDSPKSSKGSPLNDGDFMGPPNDEDRLGSPSPISDGWSMCHTEHSCEDGPMAGGVSTLKRVLRFPSWKRHSTSSSSDHCTCSRSTTVYSLDLHMTPVTPIDGPASPVSVASHEEALSPLPGYRE